MACRACGQTIEYEFGDSDSSDDTEPLNDDAWDVNLPPSDFDAKSAIQLDPHRDGEMGKADACGLLGRAMIKLLPSVMAGPGPFFLDFIERIFLATLDNFFFIRTRMIRPFNCLLPELLL